MDPVVQREFVTWKQEPVLDHSSAFMQRVYTEDIDLCLAFPNSTLAHLVSKAIEENSIFIEEVNPRQKSSCPKLVIYYLFQKFFCLRKLDLVNIIFI